MKKGVYGLFKLLNISYKEKMKSKLSINLNILECKCCRKGDQL